MNFGHCCAIIAVMGMFGAGCASQHEDQTKKGWASSAGALSMPDHTHSGVGALVFRRSNGTLWNLCSGALISPTVFVTAAHCTESAKFYASLPRLVGVTFDQTITTDSPVIPGTPISSPDYNPAAYNINNDSHDIGVVVLSEPVTGRAIYPLAPDGTFGAGKVKAGSPITQVGYGVDQNGESGLPGQVTTNDMTRDYGTAKFRAATAYLMADQVHSDGMCFGDSGGPGFMTIDGQEKIVGLGVVINGYDCNQVAWLYRVDSAPTRAFLGQYVTLP